MTPETEVKLFLLADMIDDILLNESFKFTEKYLYKQITNNVKQLTKKYSKSGVTDLSVEFDEYKKEGHKQIDLLLDSSK